MEPLKPPKFRVIERVVTGATILIWVGVLLMAAGLTTVYLNVRAEQQAEAQAQALSFAVIDTSTPTASPTSTVSATPSHTPTSTPTPRLPTPTPDYVATYVWIKDLGIFPFDGSPTATPTPSATPTFTATPVPTPTPGEVIPAAGPPNRIVIPSINLDAPVVQIGWHIEEQGGLAVSVWDVPDNAAGWHETSAYPGQSGNVVLNGHHNIRGEVFRYLIDLEPGARIQLHADGKVYYYNVAEKQILKEKGQPAEVRYQNAQWIAPTQDERLTLVTCWPYTSNSHRLIIVASPYQPTLPLPE